MIKHIEDNNDWALPLCGGDDYELCFTVPENFNSEIINIAKFCKIKITKIGVISDSKHLKIIGYEGQGESYQHF
jgi:thiamine-monophosphate kinase